MQAITLSLFPFRDKTTKTERNVLPLDRRTQMAPSSFSNVLSGDIRNGEYMVKSCIEQIPMWHYLRAIYIPLHLPDKDNWNNPYCKYMERV